MKSAARQKQEAVKPAAAEGVAPPPKEITLTLTTDEAAAIVSVLAKLSYEQSAGLIHKIQAQARQQLGG